MNVDFEKNPKQFQFFQQVISAVYGHSNKRHLFYGGGIRGGKTFVCATSFMILAKKYPHTRWHCFRSSFPALQGTTLPTFEKIVDGDTDWGWSRDKSNYFLYNRKTDSKIFFKGENISHDPELNDLLGLETNGIFYEQIEELSEKLWNIGNSRNGSWYVPKMPVPITLATFNPTQNWIKKKVHEPFMLGTLHEKYYYQLALPTDNYFITNEQKSAWDNLDERYKRQFIEGDWSNFDLDGNRWAYAYAESKHCVDDLQPINSEYIISFDFNRNPITCIIAQVLGYSKILVHESIKLANSDIYELCEVIKMKYGNKLLLVTGDASGNSSSALVRDNLNYYTVIKAQLGLNSRQLMVPTINPPLSENRILVNSLLSRGDIKINKAMTKPLQFDLENVAVLPDGTLKKTDRNDPTQQADTLDCFRYLCNTFCKQFLNS